MPADRKTLTDEEVICTWMEPKPKDHKSQSRVSEIGWWKAVFTHPANVWKWFPNDGKTDSLDALWEVEERLSEGQRKQYRMLVEATGGYSANCLYWSLLHATAAQKIKALASVLRPLVEARNAQ